MSDVFETLKGIHGSDAAAARAIGCKTRQQYHRWKKTGIPPKWFPAVVTASDGALTLSGLHNGYKGAVNVG